MFDSKKWPNTLTKAFWDTQEGQRFPIIRNRNREISQEVLNLSSNQRKTKYKFRFSLLSEYQKLEKQFRVKSFDVETLFFRRFRVFCFDRIFPWTKHLICGLFQNSILRSSSSYLQSLIFLFKIRWLIFQ